MVATTSASGTPAGRSHRHWLVFDDGVLEAEFRAELAQAALPAQRITIAIGFVATALFGGLALWLLAGVGTITVVCFHGVLMGVFVLLLGLSYTAWFVRVADVVSAGACALLGLAFQWEVWLVPLPTAYAAFATAVFIVYASTLARLTFRSAVAVTTVLVSGFVVFGVVESLPADLFVMYLAFTADFGCAALVGGYLLERSRRREFLTQRELAAARAEADGLVRQLRGTVGAEEVRRDLLGAVHTSVHPASAWLWLPG